MLLFIYRIMASAFQITDKYFSNKLKWNGFGAIDRIFYVNIMKCDLHIRPLKLYTASCIFSSTFTFSVSVQSIAIYPNMYSIVTYRIVTYHIVTHVP